MGYESILMSGINFDCTNMHTSIGVEKDLILVNYKDFDRASTLASNNIESDNSNNNEGGLTKIIFNEGGSLYAFKGSTNSVSPSIKPKFRDDDLAKYDHDINFVIFSKTAKTRKLIESFPGNLLVAIFVEKNTGLYEIFGVDRGLKISAINRKYQGSALSNTYSINLRTPSSAKLKESTMGHLAVGMYMPNEGGTLQGELQYQL